MSICVKFGTSINSDMQSIVYIISGDPFCTEFQTQKKKNEVAVAPKRKKEKENRNKTPLTITRLMCRIWLSEDLSNQDSTVIL